MSVSPIETLYQIKAENRGVSSVTICRNTPLNFKVFTQYEDEIKETFSKHSGLLSHDKSVSLFETESIMDYVNSSWLYDESQWIDHDRVMSMDGNEITELFVNYILFDEIPEWLEVCRYNTPDKMEEKFGGVSSCSDADILDVLMFLDFDTIEGNTARVSPQRVDSLGMARGGSDYNFEKGVDYQSIINAVRQRYGISREESKGMDYAISEAVNKYISSLVPWREELEEEIKILAKRTANTKAFKTSVKKLLEENDVSLVSNGGSCGGCGEGYSIDMDHGFNDGSFTIGTYNIVKAFSGESDFDKQEMSTKGEKFKENKLWEAVYSEFSASLF